MQVFISYAREDQALARELASQLSEAGLKVWNSDEEIHPGDNWAKKIGQALEDSEVMVILFTPHAARSDFVRQELEYALSSKNYQGRLVTVTVGAADDIPWILKKLPIVRVQPTEYQTSFGQVVQQVQALAH